MRKTKVINFYGGPSCGKSNMALAVAAELKFRQASTEYIPEYAKDLVYQKATPDFFANQLYISAKQHKRIYHCLGKVDYIVTDSPILLGSVYGDSKELSDLLCAHYNEMDNINILMTRGDYFEEEGRIHDLSESMEVDNKIYRMLNLFKIPYYIFTCSRNNVALIADIVEGKC